MSDSSPEKVVGAVANKIEDIVESFKRDVKKYQALMMMYIEYYGWAVIIALGGLLLVLLINSSLAGSAIGLVIQPMAGFAMIGITIFVELMYFYFTPKPEEVAGVDLHKEIKKPSSPVNPAIPSKS